MCVYICICRYIYIYTHVYTHTYRNGVNQDFWVSTSFKENKTRIQLKAEISLSTVLKLKKTLVLKPMSGRKREWWVCIPACCQYLHHEGILKGKKSD